MNQRERRIRPSVCIYVPDCRQLVGTTGRKIYGRQLYQERYFLWGGFGEVESPKKRKSDLFSKISTKRSTRELRL